MGPFGGSPSLRIRPAEESGARPVTGSGRRAGAVRHWILTVVAVTVSIAGLAWARAFLIPIVVALLVACGIEPIVRVLERVRLPRALAAAILLVMIVGGGVAAIYALRDEAAALVDTLPRAAQKLRHHLSANGVAEDGPIAKVQKAASEIEKAANVAAGTPPPSPDVVRVQLDGPDIKTIDYLWRGGAGLLEFAGQVTMILFLVFFLLVSKDLIRRKLIGVAGAALSRKRLTIEILNEISDQIGRFLLLTVVTSVVVGVATWLVLLYLGLEQPAVWGIAAGVCNTIPYIGPLIVAAGLAIVAFMQFDSLAMALTVAAISAVITSLEGWLLIPWLSGKATRMNPVALFVGLLFWSWLWEVPGMVLAVPMMTILKVVSDRVEDLRPVGDLLGD